MGSAPDRLLTLGEAAELLGLPDMVLGREVRAGRLETAVGWRRGRLTRVVRAGELASLDPTVLERQLPPAVPVELSSVEALEPQEIGTSAEVTPGTGTPAPSAQQPAGSGGEAKLEVSSSVNARDTAPAPAQGASPGDAPASASVPDGEVASPGGAAPGSVSPELSSERAAADGGVAHELQQVLELRRVQHAVELEEERAVGARSARRVVALQRTQWALLAGLGLVLALALPSVDDGGLVHGAASVDPPAAPLAPATQQGQPEASPAVVPMESRWATEAEATPRLPVPVPVQLPGPFKMETGEVETGKVETGEVETSVDVGSASLPEEPPASHETLGPTPAKPGEPPCAYFERTRPGEELRALLGPCSGAWSDEHQAVAGVLRRGGEAYCRHHHFFAEQLRGSVARAEEVAALAEREGLVPPLLDLRIDRAGAAFLRRRVGDWVESGFEAGLVGGEGHGVTPLGEDQWHLRSWVRYLDVGGVEHRRVFEMDLRLDDGPEGDRLLSFEWQ